MQDFRREQLAEPRDLEEYAVLPANESGDPLASDERLDEILKQVWGYSPFDR